MLQDMGFVMGPNEIGRPQALYKQQVLWCIQLRAEHDRGHIVWGQFLMFAEKCSIKQGDEVWFTGCK